MSKLITDYFDSTKDIFLHPTTANILNEVRKEGNPTQLSREDIIRFRQSLYDISREAETRILRGKRRHLATRKWISFAPGKGGGGGDFTNYQWGPVAIINNFTHFY